MPKGPFFYQQNSSFKRWFQAGNKYIIIKVLSELCFCLKLFDIKGSCAFIYLFFFLRMIQIQSRKELIVSNNNKDGNRFVSRFLNFLKPNFILVAWFISFLNLDKNVDFIYSLIQLKLLWILIYVYTYVTHALIKIYTISVICHPRKFPHEHFQSIPTSQRWHMFWYLSPQILFSCSWCSYI